MAAEEAKSTHAPPTTVLTESPSNTYETYIPPYVHTNIHAEVLGIIFPNKKENNVPPKDEQYRLFLFPSGLK